MLRRLQIACVVSLLLALPPLTRAASLDSAFGTDGRALLDFGGTASAVAGDMAIQPDGKIVAVGWIGGAFGVVRLQPDGSLDSSFGRAGVTLPNFGTDTPGRTPPALGLQPDGGIVVAGPGRDVYSAGGMTDFAVVRLKPDGSLDESFGQAGKAVLQVGVGGEIAEDVLIQPDGKIVVVGYGYQSAGTNSDFAAIRLTPTGRFDTSFGTGGIAFVPMVPDSGMDSASAAALLADGKLLLAGVTARPDTGFDFAATRLTPAGQIDTAFGTDGRVVLPMGTGAWQEVAQSVFAQPDGSWFIGGAALQPGFGPSQVALARFTAGGAPDPTFGVAGQFLAPVGTLEDMSNGLVVDGTTTYLAVDSRDAGGRRIGVLALDRSGKPDPTFGDAGTLLFHITANADEHVAAIARRADGALVEFATVRAPRALNDAFGFAVVLPRSHQAVDPAPTPGDTDPVPVAVAPRSVITSPRAGAKLRRVTTVRGTASGSFGVDRVEVALFRVTRTQCWYLVNTKPAFRKRPLQRGTCPALVWKRAGGASSWRLNLRGRLPAGRYVVRSRALRGSLIERLGKPGATNRVAFTIR